MKTLRSENEKLVIRKWNPSETENENVKIQNENLKIWKWKPSDPTSKLTWKRGDRKNENLQIPKMKT